MFLYFGFFLQIKAVVKALKDDLTVEKLGTYNAAMALANIIPSARQATKEEFLQILNARTMQDIRVCISLKTKIL